MSRSHPSLRGGRPCLLLRRMNLASWSLLLALGGEARARAHQAPPLAPLPLVGLVGVTLRASDLTAVRAYYGQRAGFRELPAGTSGGARFAVGPGQWLEFVPGALPEYTVRFVKLTLAASNLRALAAGLQDRALAPRVDARAVSVRDPAGHLLEFVAAPTAVAGRAARVTPGFSQHLQHVGLVFPDSLAEAGERFYRELLGLPESFRMGKGGRPGLIKYRLPGPRGDVVELIFTSGPLNKWAAGSAYHVNFAVPDIAATYCRLRAGGLATEDRHRPKVNAERLWAIDMIDPELTRVEIQVPEHAREEVGAELSPPCARPGEPLPVWDGKGLAGWRGEEGVWRAEGGQLVGQTHGFSHHATYLWHERAVLGDFLLSADVRLDADDGAAAAIQVRSQPINGGNRARGYRVVLDARRAGWIVHEEGRGVLTRGQDGMPSPWRAGDWNRVEVLAVDAGLWTAVNGKLVGALEEGRGERIGRLALGIDPGPGQRLLVRGLRVVQSPPVALAGLDEAALRAALASPPPPPAGK